MQHHDRSGGRRLEHLMWAQRGTYDDGHAGGVARAKTRFRGIGLVRLVFFGGGGEVITLHTSKAI